MIDFFFPVCVCRRISPNSLSLSSPSPMPRAFADFKELEKAQRKMGI